MDQTSVSLATAASATSVADARASASASARDSLEALGRPAIAAQVTDTVVLVVSELVTNALRHRGGTCTLEPDRPPGRHRGGRPRRLAAMRPSRSHCRSASRGGRPASNRSWRYSPKTRVARKPVSPSTKAASGPHTLAGCPSGRQSGFGAQTR